MSFSYLTAEIPGSHHVFRVYVLMFRFPSLVHRNLKFNLGSGSHKQYVIKHATACYSSKEIRGSVSKVLRPPISRTLSFFFFLKNLHSFCDYNS